MSGDPLTGSVPCFFSHGKMLVKSKIVPAGVQTGCAKGCRESEQKLTGRRLKDARTFPFADLETPYPALAEYASPDAHSE